MNAHKVTSSPHAHAVQVHFAVHTFSHVFVPHIHGKPGYIIVYIGTLLSFLLSFESSGNFVRKSTQLPNNFWGTQATQLPNPTLIAMCWPNEYQSVFECQIIKFDTNVL